MLLYDIYNISILYIHRHTRTRICIQRSRVYFDIVTRDTFLCSSSSSYSLKMIFFHISNWPQIDTYTHTLTLTLRNRCIPSAWPVHAPHRRFPWSLYGFSLFQRLTCRASLQHGAPLVRGDTRLGLRSGPGILRASRRRFFCENPGPSACERKLRLEGMLLDLAMSGSAFPFVSGEEWLSSRSPAFGASSSYWGGREGGFCGYL